MNPQPLDQKEAGLDGKLDNCGAALDEKDRVNVLLPITCQFLQLNNTCPVCLAFAVVCIWRLSSSFAITAGQMEKRALRILFQPKTSQCTAEMAKTCCLLVMLPYCVTLHVLTYWRGQADFGRDSYNDK